jgi:hypothetical protein
MCTLGLKAGHAGLLCGVFLFQVAIGLSSAQSAEPGGAQPPSLGETAKDVAKESGPFGGCEPIGMTASGELVFPLECRKLIKKPAEAPIAADDKVPADDKTASTDAKPAAPSQSAAVENPASTDGKPAAGEATAAIPAAPAEHKHQASSNKPEALHKAASLDPAPTAKPSVAKPSMTKPSSGKPSSSKAASSKSPEAPAKDTAKGAQIDASKPAIKATRLATTRPMIVLAKPMAATTPVSAKPQSEAKPPLRTAGMPACMQFRSYNPTTKSYRGYDGHIYACH